MKLFKRNRFKQIKTDFDYKSFEMPSKEEVNSILEEFVNPFASELGLTKCNKKNQWFGSFNTEGIKSVLEFTRLKGLSGAFKFGNCFNFLPTISSSKKLLNHRTDRSTKLHLFESTYKIRNNLSDHAMGDLISFHNKIEFQNSLLKLVEKYKPIISMWYDNNKTISENINSAKYQLSVGSDYLINSPSLDYVLSFLYMKIGEDEKSTRHLNKFIETNKQFLNEGVELKIRRLINNENNISN